MGKLWKKYKIIMKNNGKLIEKSWKNYGKTKEKLWKIIQKL